ncbi:unnamed protein product [Hymenolepis diminuta]|uniref:Reverse transcriptase n=1 Tax=Hymenolepis diminuta TaxID=6216 RepID=A0A0R3SQZ2_HYMDI|nr:unnamed protein product [Hymenolepis diminuta]
MFKVAWVIPIESAASSTIINKNVIRFPSGLFGDLCRGLNITLLHSPPNLNGLDEQLVDIVNRQLLVLGTGRRLILVRHCKYLRSRYATVSSEPKTDPAVIDLNAYYFHPPGYSEAL